MEPSLQVESNILQALQKDDIVGTLEVDKLADILVIDGDPFEDITLLEDPTNFYAVIQNGIIKSGHCLNS